MDPLAVVVGAIIAGVAAGSGSITEQAVRDAYLVLKSLIKSKYGEGSNVLHAVESIERKPGSPGRQETLKEELSAVEASRDEHILQAAQKLLDSLKQIPDGEKHVQLATGSYIAQADRGSKASVEVGEYPDT